MSRRPDLIARTGDMTMQRSTWIRIVVGGALACTLWGASGCEPSSSVKVSELAQPHQASPEALVDHLNVLMTQDPPQLVLMTELLHAETDFQQELVDDLVMFAPLAEFDRELRKRFDRGVVLPGARFAFQFTAMPVGGFDPISLVESSDRRGRAVREGGRSNAQIEYDLVEIDGRWWISGYTLEHDGATGLVRALAGVIQDASRFDARHAGPRHALAAIAETSRLQLQKIRAREFRSVEAARVSFHQSLGRELDTRGIKLIALEAEKIR